MRADRKLTTWAVVAAAAILAAASAGCDYIVPPYQIGTPTPFIHDAGWAGIVNNVTESGGALHVDLSIVNNTNQWSAMDVGASQAKVTKSDGGSQDCGTVFVGTSVFVNKGGWYLAPGFVMRGYTGGSVAAPETQMLYVECSGVSMANGKTLSITYSYISGPYNYYVPTKATTKTMTLDLGNVVTDTVYPVAEKLDSLAIVKIDDGITGINNYTLRLTSAARTDTGFEFGWESSNPTNYPGRIYIGKPPVIGADGILYGFYQTPHLTAPPITPAGGTATWTTEVAVPSDVTGFYILLPVETQQQKYFVDHVVDITGV